MDSTGLGAWLGRDFGLDVARLHPVGLGADARADLHRVVATDGREYAAKTSSGSQPGLAVADLLARRGVPGVPWPLRSRHGDLVAGDAARGTRLSVLPWVHGERVLDTGMTPGQWVLLGELLGRVHTTPTSAPELAVLPREDHDPHTVVAQLGELGAVVAHAAATHPGDPAVAEVRSLWTAEGERLVSVAGLAERLGAAPRWSSTLPVLCHGDPHHGNLVTDAAGQVWLIDWDDAVLAPREADLMFVVGGVFSHGTITAHQVGWFFDGYTPATGVAPGDLDLEVLTYLRCVRALVDVLDLLAVAAAPTEHDLPTRQQALHHARRTFGPSGLVALALG